MTDPQTPATALPRLSVRTAATELLGAIDKHDNANIHGWSVALRAALAAEPPALDVERIARARGPEAMTDPTPATEMPGACRHYACDVPIPHRHRKPNAAEVQAAESTYIIQHPPTCAWRKDIYDGCSCGVTQHITDLYTLGAVVR